MASRKAEVIAELRKRSAGHQADFPASHNQRSLWFLHQLAPGRTPYNLTFAVRIRSRLDVAALQDALQGLVDRHAILRTTYRTVDEELRQVVHRSVAVSLSELDVSGWTEAAIEAQVVSRSGQPFDLEQGLLFRPHLLTRQADDHILLLSTHHIAVDGWSSWILLDELRTLYAARVHGRPAILPRTPAQYSDFTKSQLERLAGAVGENLWTYWKEKLAGDLPTLQLRADRPRPPSQTFQVDSYSLRLPPGLQSAIGSLGRAEGITAFIVMLTAYYLLLHLQSGQLDIIVGSPTFGRDQPEYQNLVGDCIGLVALRTDLSGDPSLRALFKRVQNSVVGALDHQDFPFSLLVERLGPRRDPSRTPVFQTMFALQRPQRASGLTELFIPGEAPRKIDFGGLVVERYSLPNQQGQFDLVLDIVVAGEAPIATLRYNTDLFNPGTAVRLLESYIGLLERMVANPGARLSSIATVEGGGPRDIVEF